jgi:hypothetical protein
MDFEKIFLNGENTLIAGIVIPSFECSMVLPHLQYCLIVWGNYEADRNRAQGETLLKLQKRFVGLISGKGGCYYANPLFAEYGILKVGDLYRQQLRMHS